HTRSKRDWSSDVCSSDLPSLSCPAISRKTRPPPPPTKWRGYWKRKPLLHRNRPIRREPGHEKSGHAGERGRYSSVTKTISPSWYISIIHSWCSRADERYPLNLVMLWP